MGILKINVSDKTTRTKHPSRFYPKVPEVVYILAVTQSIPLSVLNRSEGHSNSVRSKTHVNSGQ